VKGIKRVEMKAEIVKALEEIVGKDYVLTERDAILDYLVDETCLAVRPKPAEDVVIVKPGNAEQVSSIMKFANGEKVPVFPRGAGTGLVGGAIPTENGIVLSLERMDKILEIDTENLMAVVEAGVPFSKVNEEAEKHGLFFPPHPGDESAQIGGIVACNAGGVRCVRYGVLRDHVKGMEVVLPTGEILLLGGKLLKNVAGYSLMHLIIGSQGTLGIITKVVIRLYPKFKATASLIISYKDRHDAINTVPKILREGLMPLAIEYVDRKLIEESAKNLGKRWSSEKGDAFLYIIVSGESEEDVYREAEKIYKICSEYNAVEGLIETSKRKQDDILAIRSNTYLAFKPQTADTLDIVVPPASIGKMLDALDRIAEKYGIYIPVCGHAADGNLHPDILEENAGGPKKEDTERIKREIYSETKKLGGAITGEHGIGKIRTKNLVEILDEKEIEMIKAIKRIFDPNSILNPRAVIP
jgi:glycolate oxidase